MAAHTVRLLADTNENTGSVPDHHTGKAAFWWSGNDLRIETSPTENGRFLLAPEIGALTATIKAAGAAESDAPVMDRKTLGSADCDATFTPEEWENKTGQLCVFEWTDDEANIPAGEYLLIIHHVDLTGKKNTYLKTRITVTDDCDDQGTAVNAPTPGPPTAYSKADVDALLSGYLIASALPGEWRLFEPGHLQWRDSDNGGAWNTVIQE